MNEIENGFKNNGYTFDDIQDILNRMEQYSSSYLLFVMTIVKFSMFKNTLEAIKFFKEYKSDVIDEYSLEENVHPRLVISLFKYINFHPENLDWTMISNEINSGDEEFIDCYYNYLDWDIISKTVPFTKDSILKYCSVLNWKKVVQYQVLDEVMYSYFSDYIDINAATIFQKFSSEFIDKNKDRLNVHLVCKYQESVSNEYLLNHISVIDWTEVNEANKEKIMNWDAFSTLVKCDKYFNAKDKIEKIINRLNREGLIDE